MKLRVVELLLVTTIPTMVLAEGGWPSIQLMAVTLIGGTLAAGGANAINMYIDRDIDKLMVRTQNRPLVTGALTPRAAMIFAIALEFVAFLVLWAGANLLAAVLAVSATLFYVFVYSLWLKRTSKQNILIGGAMGKVGLAAAAIAKVYGARVIGIKRKNTPAVPGHACDVLFDLEDPDLLAKLMAETQNQGYPLFYNTVGSPYLALSLDVLMHKGKQILISTLARDCPFDIFKFFRKEMTFFGVDTLKKDTVASNHLLAQLLPHIASGRLQLPQVRSWTGLCWVR